MRCTFDVADKLGLEGPGAAFESVSFVLDIESPAPVEQVRKLIQHAERACHAAETLRKPIPVTMTATLNRQKLDL
ncbi:MAG: hypothetical protein ACE5JU_18330 [Candidatus Binatia bacterium]